MWGRLRGVHRLAGEFPRYPAWLAQQEIGPDERAADEAAWAGSQTETLTAVIPTYHPDLGMLAGVLDSLRQQTYTDWNAVIVDDGTRSQALSSWLSGQAAGDPRIRVVTLPDNLGIARATNKGIEAATGTVIGFVDHDDRLAPNAFSEVMKVLAGDPDCQCVFTDEDKLDARGRRHDPYFKPGFNRALLYARNYVNHLTVVRRSAMLRIGALDPRRDGAQDYDLVLRLLEEFGASALRHAPVLAYSWRGAEARQSFSSSQPDRAWQAGRDALDAHLSRCGAAFDGIEGAFGGGWRIRFPSLADSPHIAAIIPTRDRLDLLEACIEMLFREAGGEPVELVVVDNGSRQAETLDYLEALPARFAGARVVRAPGAFNYSRLINLGVKATTAPLLLLLNNDVADGRDGWLGELAGWARMDWVGCAGARLQYPDGTLQHGGVVLGPGGAAGHYERHAAPEDAGAFGHLRLPRCCAAVTAACLMVRRTVFDAVGGFDEAEFPVAFSDVDFCLRVRAAGFENVWTPHACLTHFEGATRGRESGALADTGYLAARTSLQARWGDLIRQAPYTNPALDPGIEGVGLRDPGR